jgi:HSP20 family molecular chaperone IbpA
LLTVDLDGMGPEEVQIRTQGQSIVISRAHSAQELQKDSFDDGRGFVRSFSYSSGTSSRRLSVPRDADLSAMSREDGEGRIQIRIPRQGR